MDESLDMPKVGKLDKKVVVPIVVVAAGYIGYRYYRARQDVGTGDTTVDPGYEDMTGGLGPGVTRPDNSYGLPDDASSSGNSTGGFRGNSNSEWSEYVTDRLQQDGRWTYSVIAVALGNFLSDKPLSTEQQDIVRAAIGIAGQPPVGYHTLIPGGNAALTVAPTGVAGTAAGPDSIRVTFTNVSGAATYNAYVNGSPHGTAAASPITIAGLEPGRTYSIQVAGVSASGQAGPKSSAISVKTPGAAMPKPAQPQVTVNTGGGRVTLTTHAVPYATSYIWVLNGKIAASTNGPAVTMTRLKTKGRFSVSVQVSAATGKPGPLSATTSFTTK